MIKAIIFDLGGVVLKHPATLLTDIFSRIFSVSKEQSIKWWSKYRVKLLVGSLSSKELLQILKDETKNSQSLAELFDQWEKLYIDAAEIDNKMLKFLETLRGKYKLYLLTDTIDIHDQYNKKRQIYEKFDRAFKSHEERLSKAEGEKLFLNVLKKINLKAPGCVFIDDLKEYVNTAKGLGMKAIMYKNLLQLQEDLHNFKVIK